MSLRNVCFSCFSADYGKLSTTPLVYAFTVTALFVTLDVLMNSSDHSCGTASQLDAHTPISDCSDVITIGYWHVKPNICHLTTKMLALQVMCHAFLFSTGIRSHGISLSYCVGITVSIMTIRKWARYKDVPYKHASFHDDVESYRFKAYGIIWICSVFYLGMVCIIRNIALRKPQCAPYSNNSVRFCIATMAAITMSSLRVVLLIVAVQISIVVYLCFYAVIYIDHRVLTRWFTGANACGTGEVLVVNQIMHVIPAITAIIAVFVHREYVKCDVEFIASLSKHTKPVHVLAILTTVAHICTTSILIPSSLDSYTTKYYSPKLANYSLLMFCVSLSGIVIADLCLYSSIKRSSIISGVSVRNAYDCMRSYIGDRIRRLCASKLQPV